MTESHLNKFTNQRLQGWRGSVSARVFRLPPCSSASCSDTGKKPSSHSSHFLWSRRIHKNTGHQEEKHQTKLGIFSTGLDSFWPILTLHEAGRNFEEENYFLHPALEEDEDRGFIASMSRTVMCEVQDRKIQSLQPVLNIGRLQQVKPFSFSSPNSRWEAEITAEDSFK